MSSKPARIDEAGISARFGEASRTVAAWTRLLNFPPPLPSGARDAAKVDAWVQANRPQSWRNRKELPPAPTPAPAAPASKTRQPRPGSAPPRVETLRQVDIARRFDLPISTVGNWVDAEDFPAPDAGGRWAAKAVDAWVREHRPWTWADHTGAEPPAMAGLPDGHPDDLLGIGAYAEIMGNALRNKPYGRGTLLSYKSRGQIPPPDRTKDDGKTPRVFEDMWMRSTIYADLRTRRPGIRRPT